MPHSSDLERAVVLKGRHLPAPLVLIHPSASSQASSSLDQQFARHAQKLYRFLLAAFRDSSRYEGVIAVGLEDLPQSALASSSTAAAGDEEGERVIYLDGFTDPYGVTSATPHHSEEERLDLSSLESFLGSIQAVVGEIEEEEEAGDDPQHPPLDRPSVSKKENQNDGEDDQDGGEWEALALGIDSLTMLLGVFGFKPTLRLLKALRKIKGLSPLLMVLYADNLSLQSRLALEDLATTNIYLYPDDVVDGGGSGHCLVVRKSLSGKVHETWESYAIIKGQLCINAEGGRGELSKASLGERGKVASLTASTTGSAGATGTGGGKGKDSFLESLPFKLTLNEQEKDMRGKTVLPHERHQMASGVRAGSTSGGEGGGASGAAAGGGEALPLIYHEGDLDSDEEEEEDDDDIDDDLDI